MPSRSLTDCAPGLAELWVAVRGDCERAAPGRAYVLTCTYRSPEEQWALYRVGRHELADGSWTPDDDPATKILTVFDGSRRRSKHNLRPARALDFAVLIGGKVSWDFAEYELVGRTAEGRGLVWGGRWKTLRDGPHLELPD